MATVKKPVRLITALAVIAILAVIFSSAGFVVSEGKFACVKRFSRVVSVKDQAGLYFRLPFVDSVQYLEKKKMMYDMNASDVLTSDKKAMIVDNYILWRITDPLAFIRTVNSIPEVETRIDAAVYSSVKNLMGTLEQSRIISQETGDEGSGGRSDINQAITLQVAENLKDYGIEIISVEIKRLDLPADNAQAIYSRMISERVQMAASFRAEGSFEAAKIKNEADKSVGILVAEAQAAAERLRGEGESEYMRILSETYQDPARSEFYEFMRMLDGTRNSLTGEKTLILSADSPLAAVLSGRP